ncbi:MAG: DUF1015 domain-containing protein, partial [Blautia sp.]|nr:DUF1015 domain-containing protein [Blautia sp.]
KNPHSFLHIDRAEMDLPEGMDIYDPKVYEKARENLHHFEEDGLLRMDAKPCYYLYQLEREGKVQTGVVGCASIDDYLSGVVKKHELTREEKEQDRIHHVDVCDANTGPIYLAGRFPKEGKDLIASITASRDPVYAFTEEDEISHRVWVVDEKEEVDALKRVFDSMDAFYIADGHHRAASAVKVGLLRREQHPGYTGEEEFNYFLSVVFPYEELTILGYHRVVLYRNGLSKEDLLGKLKESFEVQELSQAAAPSRKHEFLCALGGKWYLLTAKPSLYEGRDVVAQLDVSILQREVLSPVLGISDPRTDDRIRFVGGSHALSELGLLAEQNEGVSFALYPTSMEDLMRIADEGKLMPPKSTWFEPKLRSGLFIHELSK